MTANQLLTLSRKSITAAALLLTLNAPEAKAQHPDQTGSSTVATRLIRYEVKQRFQARFRKAISDYVASALNTGSNILSEAYYEQDKPSVLWIIERWTNKTALDKSNESIPFKAINALSKTGLVQPAEIFFIKDLEPLSKQQWRNRPGKEDKPITIMLFVDSRPGTENDFKKVYNTAMPLFRSEPGVINYQLSQFENDNTRFVTYEKFRDEAAFQYHLNFPPIKPVIDYLNTSIKEQPFQTGLHRLIAFASLPIE